ncbi:M48 family metallopeptidase [Kozakia baliensis]|uniref:Peptidase M48 domain-containing protein n=1 Tax=Kozakia baliensis TaxID=153496 RepID=A0A1D8UYC6_9PROT|nr:M48 family metallopeptidase [Kozakia baliensis]AOX18596.1 hypothetical protein A0U89_13955 [Kozakia baliensis]
MFHAIRSRLAVLGVALLTSCTSVANMTGDDTQSLNLQAQQQYGQVVTHAMQRNMLVRSGADYDMVRTVLLRLEPFADRANKTGVPFQWHLAVFKTNEINAWVMPGGLVGVYTGLIDRLHLTEAETAAVLGHEMIHALEEHAKEKAGEKTLSNLATLALSAYAGSAAGAALGAASTMGVGLPFSRRLETRADLGGMMLMAEAGYDPHAALSLWRKMASLQGQAGKEGLAQFLSDHPNDADRQAAIEAELPKAMTAYEQARTPAW